PTSLSRRLLVPMRSHSRSSSTRQACVSASRRWHWRWTKIRKSTLVTKLARECGHRSHTFSHWILTPTVSSLRGTKLTLATAVRLFQVSASRCTTRYIYTPTPHALSGGTTQGRLEGTFLREST